MTLINHTFSRPGPLNIPIPVTGIITCQPTRKRVITGTPDNTVLPAPFPHAFIGTLKNLNLAPTNGEWCWKLTYKIPGVSTWEEYVLVPEVPAIDLTDLVRVNPDSLNHEPEAQSIWWAKMDELLKLGGVPGKDGKDGIDGRDGRDGIDGINGQDGRDGLDGNPGSDGRDGIDGKDAFGLIHPDNFNSLQEWIDAGGSILPNKTYTIDTGLVVNGNNRVVNFGEGKIISTGTNITMLTVTGDNSSIIANLDGANRANYGLKVTGANCTIKDSTLENYRSDTTTARAIEVNTNGGARILNNTINNVYSAPNDKLADSPGMARGILLYSETPALAYSIISGNTVTNINGEEGDGIAILFSRPEAGKAFSNARALIYGNTVTNVSRRHIKIQGSNVIIKNNVLDADTNEVTGVNITTSLDIIESDDIKMSGNLIGISQKSGSIAVNGSASIMCKNIVVDNNESINPEASAFHIYMKYVQAPQIFNNKTRGGTYLIAMSESTDAIIKDNTHSGGTNTDVTFRLVSTNPRAIMMNNLSLNGNRTTHFQNPGVGSYTAGNYNAPKPVA